MARRVQQLGMKARLLLCDTFQGVAKAGENDPWYKGGEHSDTSPEHVRGLAEQLGVDVELLIGMFPDETSDQIDDVTLRLVHIDVDVYDSARDTLEWAWPRLSVGGVVIWDDYGSFQCEGVATLGRRFRGRPHGGPAGAQHQRAPAAVQARRRPAARVCRPPRSSRSGSAGRPAGATEQRLGLLEAAGEPIS